jgi:oxygen-independent coproporphyrinogen-3 oxidase
MEEVQSILALGGGASSKFVMKQPQGVRIERVENVKSVKDYIERIDEMIGRKRAFLDQYKDKLI